MQFSKRLSSRFTESMRSAMSVAAGAVGYALRPLLGDIGADQTHQRENNRADGGGHRGAGISDLPPAVENAQQDSLPPRGSRKPGVHA